MIWLNNRITLKEYKKCLGHVQISLIINQKLHSLVDGMSTIVTLHRS